MFCLEQEKAKRYSSIKYTLAIIDTTYLLLLLFFFQGLGISKILAQELSALLVKPYFVIPAYVLAGYIVYYILDFPLNFYASFILEHKFCLSKQKTKDWFNDQIKTGVISCIIFLILISAFYYILERYTQMWWLVISIFWIFFNLILAKLAPVIIIPLFFKYKKLADEELRRRIIDLSVKAKVKILDVFEIDFSKKTLKANAAFLGWGRTRRVILADTLKGKYTHDEIEVILAHEFAHYKLKHLLKLILVNSVVTVILFYLIFKTSGNTLKLFGLSSLSDIAALPVMLIYFVLFAIFTQPLENYVSRRYERDADRTALSLTGLKDAFISMMDKLAGQNLSDRNPHPIIKFFFFSHPPVDERIALAKSWRI